MRIREVSGNRHRRRSLLPKHSQATHSRAAHMSCHLFPITWNGSRGVTESTGFHGRAEHTCSSGRSDGLTIFPNLSHPDDLPTRSSAYRCIHCHCADHCCDPSSQRTIRRRLAVRPSGSSTAVSHSSRRLDRIQGISAAGSGLRCIPLRGQDRYPGIRIFSCAASASRRTVACRTRG